MARKMNWDAIALFFAPFFWLLFLVGPTLFYVYAASEAYVRLKRHQARCTWMAVLAGPLLAVGDISRRFAGHEILQRGETVWATNAFVDVGVFCFMQAAFIAFTRLVFYTQPPGPNAVFHTPRFVRVGYVLLGLSAAVVLFFFWPQQRYYAPHLTFPFCVYFLAIHLIKKRQIAEGARLKQQTTPLGPSDPGQWKALYSATLRISIILTVRSVYGMWAAHMGEFHDSGDFYYTADLFLLMLCYWIFNRNHPGFYLPREFTVGLYHGQEKEKNESGSVQIPLESV